MATNGNRSDVFRVPFNTLCKEDPSHEELLALRWAVLGLWDALVEPQQLDDPNDRNRRIVRTLDRFGMLPKRMTPRYLHGGMYVTAVGQGVDPVKALLAAAEYDRRPNDPHPHAALERIYKNVSRYLKLLEERGEAVPLGVELPSLSAVRTEHAKQSAVT